jgi:hypothetical protein
MYINRINGENDQETQTILIKVLITSSRYIGQSCIHRAGEVEGTLSE